MAAINSVIFRKNHVFRKAMLKKQRFAENVHGIQISCIKIDVK